YRRFGIRAALHHRLYLDHILLPRLPQVAVSFKECVTHRRTLRIVYLDDDEQGSGTAVEYTQRPVQCNKRCYQCSDTHRCDRYTFSDYRETNFSPTGLILSNCKRSSRTGCVFHASCIHSAAPSADACTTLAEYTSNSGNRLASMDRYNLFRVKPPSTN